MGDQEEKQKPWQLSHDVWRQDRHVTWYGSMRTPLQPSSSYICVGGDEDDSFEVGYIYPQNCKGLTFAQVSARSDNYSLDTQHEYPHRGMINLKYIHIHWASKETYHFFRVTLNKIHAIKINDIWTQISFNTP